MINKNCKYLKVESEKHFCQLTSDYCVAAEGELYRDGWCYRERTVINGMVLSRCPTREISKGLAKKLMVELVQIQLDRSRKGQVLVEKEIRSRLGDD